MHILDLPEEVLNNIAKHLRTDFDETWRWPACKLNHLLQLHRTCEKLHRLVDTLLYHTVRLYSGPQCQASLEAAPLAARGLRPDPALGSV